MQGITAGELQTLKGRLQTLFSGQELIAVPSPLQRFKRAVVASVAAQQFLSVAKPTESVPRSRLLSSLKDLGHDALANQLIAAEDKRASRSSISRIIHGRSGPSARETAKGLVRRIEDALADLAECRKSLMRAQEKERDMVRRLDKASKDCEDYAENTKNMAGIVDSLHAKLDTMVPAKSYEELRDILETKNKEIEGLGEANCEVRKELQQVKTGIADMEARMHDVDSMMGGERKKFARTECDLQMAQSKGRALEDALGKKDTELKAVSEELATMRTESEKLRLAQEERMQAAQEQLQKLEAESKVRIPWLKPCSRETSLWSSTRTRRANTRRFRNSRN